jgi:hypothetical protein
MVGLSTLRLRIVPLESLLLHEAHDAQRVERMVKAMRKDGYLRNPVIVTEQQGHYVQLDGATRAMALAEMGIGAVLVQIVDYAEPEVALSSWNHVLIGLPAARLREVVATTQGLSWAECDPHEIGPALRPRGAESPPEQGQALLGIIGREGSGLLVQGSGPRREQLGHLYTVVAAYRGQAEVRRTAETELGALLEQHPDLTAVVAFPQLTPEDVIHCAFSQTHLPMGITRHLVSGRALGVDVPLEVLGGDRSVEEKNVWLQNMILERIRRNKVRVYQEPVIIFDD